MPRVTIVADDGLVIVDGEARMVDLSDFPPEIHAIQWDGTRGHIERRDHKGQPAITSLDSYQVFLDRWIAAAPPPPTLDDIKAARKAEVDGRLGSALEAGMPYSGKTLQLRQQDQQNIMAMAQRAELALAGDVDWPADMAWRMADNSFLPLPTADGMIAMATAANNRVLALRRNAWAHKDAIDALGDAAAVEAYDITPGWD